jgi:hypothetical protein
MFSSSTHSKLVQDADSLSKVARKIKAVSDTYQKSVRAEEDSGYSPTKLRK